MYGLKSESSFDSAHFLSGYNGKCENLHGHRWRVVAYLEVDDTQSAGDEKDMVVDFSTFKDILRQATEDMDHMLIIEDGSLAQSTIDALESETFKIKVVPWRTTAENFARHFYEELSSKGMPVSQIDVYETPNNCAVYRP